MDEEVEASPDALQFGEHGVHGAGVHDVAGQHDLGAELGGERLNALLESVALEGEGELRTLCCGRPGYAPGDRAVVS